MEVNVDEIIEKLVGSIDIILDYAGTELEEKNTAKALIKAYTVCPDRASMDDETRKLRRALTKIFYTTYKNAFFKSVNDENMPAPVKMFLYFGYMDEKLAGAENAILLYQLASIFDVDPNGHIFTFYDWLRNIYMGNREPSINEMSLDYGLYLHQLKKEGKITDAQEAELANDKKRKVEFEINNMFQSAGKMVSGQITIFCPIFSDNQLFKSLDKTLVSYRAVYDYINLIRNIDFSCFYRETTFSNPDIGITREFVQTEVLPDIILMPSVGQRGVMWQEIAGRKRTSPARFILPFFSNEEIDKILVRMCGEFRWELCRRIQGARWNDLSDPSLTAVYCDYIETIKRNRSLSAEQKEKIKSDYHKFRNSTKEMFVNDYIVYIMHESRGSLRVNKVVREMLFEFCPFSKDIRAELSKNGMYTKLVERYKIKNAHSRHMSDMVMQKITNGGFDMPVEIREHRMFLEK